MPQEPIFFVLFLIFAGAAALASLALYAHQALLVAYILAGVLFGPSVFDWVGNPELIKQASHVGIVFLLFLLGLDLDPKELARALRKTTLVTILSAGLFTLAAGAVGYAFGYALRDCLVIGIASTFSSTIIGLKLLPTTVLHHQRTGEVMISILLLQDLLAIAVILLLQDGHGDMRIDILLRTLALPALAGGGWLVAKFLVLPLMARFDRIHEYIFLMAIGWCLAMAQLAGWAGLSHEAGAFLAGVLLAMNPIALYVVGSLKPLRDFFLILFFFSIGAGFKLPQLALVLWPALGIAAVSILVKPPVYRVLLGFAGETPGRAREVGWRLAQMSEFALLLAVLAEHRGVIGDTVSDLIQLATVLSFIISTYLVVLRFPSPIAISDQLRQD
ncbi:MAG: cation:proton antiporter [Pseudomonadota bacterium]